MPFNARKFMLPLALGALIAGAAAVPSRAQTDAAPAAAATPSAEFSQRAAEMVAFINDEVAANTLLTPKFLSRVPQEQLKSANARFRAQWGKALSLQRIQAKSPHEGEVFFKTEKGEASLMMRLQKDAPHLIDGMFFVSRVP